MGEMEGLDTHEPLQQRIERHAFDRLIMLSDGVFAIAITLAAIEIRPHGAWSDLPSLWRALQLSVFAYLLSFAVIAAYWASHRDTFARLERVDAPLTMLTLGLLFTVAILPSTTHLVYDGNSHAAFQLYCLSLAAIGLLQSAVWAYASLRPGLMKVEVSRRYRLGRVLVALVVPSFFLLMTVTTDSGFNGPLVLSAAGMTALVVLLRRVTASRREARGR